MIWMCHLLLTHLLADGHLGCCPPRCGTFSSHSAPHSPCCFSPLKGRAEKEISRYFLIQRRSKRVKAWGLAKAEGWGCGRRKVLTLDHSDGHQGGEGTEEVTVQKPGLCPLPWQGSPVGDCPDLYAPPPCRLCTFIFARSSLGRHGRHLYLAAGRTFPSWDGTQERLASLGPWQ